MGRYPSNPAYLFTKKSAVVAETLCGIQNRSTSIEKVNV